MFGPSVIPGKGKSQIGRQYMSLERELNKATKNMRDAVDEAKHRSAAEAERLDRESDSGTMTEGDRLRSALNETRHNIEADIDKGKREVRKNT